MPATMMHLAAGKLLRPNGSDLFYWGCILPDCVDGNRELKDHLHFRDVSPEKRLSSLISFGKSLHFKDDFEFGVFFHFYLDYLWDHGPQSAHRRAFSGENWFPAYRAELKKAGSRVAQRVVWNQEVWERLRTPDPILFENRFSLSKEEIQEFLSFNASWHCTEVLPESEFFTDALVDSFLHRAGKSFDRFLADFFPGEGVCSQ